LLLVFATQILSTTHDRLEWDNIDEKWLLHISMINLGMQGMALVWLVFMDMIVESKGRSHGCEAKEMCMIVLLLICSSKHDGMVILMTIEVLELLTF
jgi:uncharacterized membrane protein